MRQLDLRAIVLDAVADRAEHGVVHSAIFHQNRHQVILEGDDVSTVGLGFAIAFLDAIACRAAIARCVKPRGFGERITVPRLGFHGPNCGIARQADVFCRLHFGLLGECACAVVREDDTTRADTSHCFASGHVVLRFRHANLQ